MSRSLFLLNLQESPRKAANELLADVCMEADTSVNLVKLCEAKDWELIFRDFDDPKTLAEVELVDKDARISINTDDSAEKNGFSSNDSLRRRQRFSMAHELGHASFDSHKDSKLNAEFVKGKPHYQQFHGKRESQAHEFASELLIPQTHLIQALKGFAWDSFFMSAETLVELFDVSTTAVAIRCAKEAPFAAMTVSFDRFGKSNPCARSRDQQDTGMFYEANENAPLGSLAKDLLEDPKCSIGRKKHLNCHVWFPQGKKNRQYQLLEQAIRLGEHGAIAFLTFIENDPDEEAVERGRYTHREDDDF